MHAVWWILYAKRFYLLLYLMALRTFLLSSTPQCEYHHIYSVWGKEMTFTLIQLLMTNVKMYTQNCIISFHAPFKVGTVVFLGCWCMIQFSLRVSPQHLGHKYILQCINQCILSMEMKGGSKWLFNIEADRSLLQFQPLGTKQLYIFTTYS